MKFYCIFSLVSMTFGELFSTKSQKGKKFSIIPIFSNNSKLHCFQLAIVSQHTGMHFVLIIGNWIQFEHTFRRYPF